MRSPLRQAAMPYLSVPKDGVLYTIHGHGSDISDSDNVFSDPEIREFYKNLYEDAQYECRHWFEPDATWTKEEERRVVRKLDARGKSQSRSQVMRN